MCLLTVSPSLATGLPFALTLGLPTSIVCGGKHPCPLVISPLRDILGIVMSTRFMLADSHPEVLRVRNDGSSGSFVLDERNINSRREVWTRRAEGLYCVSRIRKWMDRVAQLAYLGYRLHGGTYPSGNGIEDRKASTCPSQSGSFSMESGRFQLSSYEASSSSLSS